MIKRTLRVDLSPSEKEAKTAILVAFLEDAEKLTTEKKEKVKMYSDLIKEKHKRSHELAEDIRTGTERRQVECDEISDYRTNRVQTKRRDTGEVIDERTMTPKERQTELNVGGKDAKKKPAPKRQKVADNGGAEK